MSGTVQIQPLGKGGEKPVDRFELFVDGAPMDRCAAGESITLDTSQYADGYHELRIVGIEASLLETQGRTILPVTFKNGNRRIDIKVESVKVKTNGRIVIEASSPGSRGLFVYGNGRLLAQSSLSEQTFQIATSGTRDSLGIGPVTFKVLGLGSSGGASRHRGQRSRSPLKLLNKEIKFLHWEETND